MWQGTRPRPAICRCGSSVCPISGEDGVVRQDPGATEMVATSSFQQARCEPHVCPKLSHVDSCRTTDEIQSSAGSSQGTRSLVAQRPRGDRGGGTTGGGDRGDRGRRDPNGSQPERSTGRDGFRTGGGAGEVPVLFGWSVLVTTSKAPVTSSTAPVTTSVAPVTKKGRYMFQKVSKLKALDPMIRSFSFLGLPSPSPPTGSAPLAAAFRSGHRERVHAPSLGPTQRRGSREVAAPWTRRCPFKDATR